MPKIFRSRPASKTKVIRPQQPSPKERGYGGRWRRFSEAFRRRHPLCAFCLQAGRTTLVVSGKTGVVDHKLPIEDGGAMFDESNLQSLCKGHHDGLKRLLQNHARETGQMHLLPLWCDDPASRPRLRGDTEI